MSSVTVKSASLRCGGKLFHSPGDLHVHVCVLCKISIKKVVQNRSVWWQIFPRLYFFGFRYQISPRWKLTPQRPRAGSCRTLLSDFDFWYVIESKIADYHNYCRRRTAGEAVRGGTQTGMLSALRDRVCLVKLFNGTGSCNSLTTFNAYRVTFSAYFHDK